MFFWRSVRACNFCFGITSTSFQCQMSTDAGSSSPSAGVGALVVSAEAGDFFTGAIFSSHLEIPRNTTPPSSGQEGLRYETMRIPEGKFAVVVGSKVRAGSGESGKCVHASATYVEPSRCGSDFERSTARSELFLRHATPLYIEDEESRTRTAPVSVLKSCTPLPVLSSALMAMASSVPV